MPYTRTRTRNKAPGLMSSHHRFHLATYKLQYQIQNVNAQPAVNSALGMRAAIWRIELNHSQCLPDSRVDTLLTSISSFRRTLFQFARSPMSLILKAEHNYISLSGYRYAALIFIIYLQHWYDIVVDK